MWKRLAHSFSHWLYALYRCNSSIKSVPEAFEGCPHPPWPMILRLLLMEAVQRTVSTPARGLAVDLSEIPIFSFSSLNVTHRSGPDRSLRMQCRRVTGIQRGEATAREIVEFGSEIHACIDGEINSQKEDEIGGCVDVGSDGKKTVELIVGFTARISCTNNVSIELSDQPLRQE